MDDRILRRYEVQERLGSGGFGTVWRAMNIQTRQVVALKKIRQALDGARSAQKTYREVEFLKAFGGHPNVVKLVQVYVASDNLDVYLALEYMDSDLDKFIKKGMMASDVSRYVMAQMILGLMYIHSGGVVHRDIKPHNILIKNNFTIKITDFGLARSIKSQYPVDDPILTQCCGTLSYMAPEVLLGSRWYTPSIDMWCAGLILVEMLTGKVLFTGNSHINVMHSILSSVSCPPMRDLKKLYPNHAGWMSSFQPVNKTRPLSHLLRRESHAAVDLIIRLLDLNPNRRLTAEQAFEHTYLTRYKCRPTLLRRDVKLPVPDETLLECSRYSNLLRAIERDLEGRKWKYIEQSRRRRT